MVAEELEVPAEQVRVVMGDTALTPDEGYTAGSMTIRMSGSALRQAAAEARQALLEMAADRLDANLDELDARAGSITVRADPARTLTYAELMGGRRFNRQLGGKAALKSSASFHSIGTAFPRLDLPGKFSGQASFVTDVRVPGMLHGRVLPPPSMGARLIDMDLESLGGLTGLVKVVHIGNFVGVVAEREEQAVDAAAQLKLNWQETATHPPQADLPAVLKAGDT